MVLLCSCPKSRGGSPGDLALLCRRQRAGPLDLPASGSLPNPPSPPCGEPFICVKGEKGANPVALSTRIPHKCFWSLQVSFSLYPDQGKFWQLLAVSPQESYCI